MKTFLENAARKAGADIIGIVDLNLLKSIHSQYLKKDINDLAFFKGSFSERLDPESVWREIKGAIAFGVCYNMHIEPFKDMSERGIISKCAYGKDYHIVLKKIAERIMHEFSSEFPCRYKIFVDTGRLSDRMMAYAAGLGFIGKNGFLINEKYGSYIFLGHILTDINLEANIQPISSCLCTKCNKCIKACPLGAYSEKGFDYKNCISYMTQKAIPYNKTRYIYGCDICQEVCPYNETAQKTTNINFTTSLELAYPELDFIIEMGEDEFNKKYGDSSLAWRGIKYLKKNALCVKQHNNL